ncbi:hypothetical protein HMPREF0168_0185 [Bifidobacterium dentium ATCC 27679]|uniref:Uncharacterized protein n=1 Tax=Bifidobacterium dentium ATCC 27679 TaxID=871562 RepID=E0Q4X8_9BIFI|nr:hypothetical protein HMPREF0168_0185 [Bifidobacterium dentium ATCC 27679]
MEQQSHYTKSNFHRRVVTAVGHYLRGKSRRWAPALPATSAMLAAEA